MDIVFATKDRKKILKLPIVPPELEWDNPQKNETMETIQGGEILIPGLRGLTTLTIDSFFPMKKYPFRKSDVQGKEAIEFFMKSKSARQPLRIVVSTKKGLELLNKLMIIENFTYGLDRVGDIKYKLDLKEFVEVVNK